MSARARGLLSSLGLLARDALLALTLTGVLPGLAVWGACALGWPVA